MTVWLSPRLVLAIYDEQLAEHGGSIGLRDAALLDGALARPLNRSGYGEPDVSELAAVCALGSLRIIRLSTVTSERHSSCWNCSCD